MYSLSPINIPIPTPASDWGGRGFNYSKKAKIRFLTDSNTFWMILGTFKIFDFLDP